MIRISPVISVILFSTATLLAQKPSPPATVPSRAPDYFILLVNAANLPASQFEMIRSFAEEDLGFTIKTNEIKADWKALPERAAALQTGDIQLVVILGKGPSHARIISAPDDGWALVNIDSLLVLKDKQDHMLKQQTMRGIGCAIGLATCLDRYCCMRISKVLTDLQDAGNNYCPPTRQAFETLANEKCLSRKEQ